MSKAKTFISLITIGALAFWVYITWDQFVQAYSKLSDLIWWVLILQIPLQFMVIYSLANFFYSYFKAVTLEKLRKKDFYKICLELNFVNTVFPSGGISGFSYLNLRMRPLGIKAATSTLAQSLRFGLIFITFLFFLGTGLIWLAIDGKVNDLVILMSGSIFVLIVMGCLVFVFLISSKKRIKGFAIWLPKMINKIIEFFHYKSIKNFINIPRLERALEEMNSNYVELMKDKKVLTKPLLYAFLFNLFDLLTLYMVALAFGVSINPGSIILAYAIANFAGLVIILPGGIGVYEFLMVEVLKIGGVDGADARVITIIYRVVKFVIFVPIGLIFYHIAIQRNYLKFSTTSHQLKK